MSFNIESACLWMRARLTLEPGLLCRELAAAYQDAHGTPADEWRWLYKTAETAKICGPLPSKKRELKGVI